MALAPCRECGGQVSTEAATRMPRMSSGAREHPPIEYRDAHGSIWHASEVAQLRVVSPAIDGPNLCLVIRFEREGEERFARWIGGTEGQQSLDRLFAEAARDPDASGMGPAPPEPSGSGATS